MTEMRNVVLVHGAWADGSSWSAVIESLQAGGFNVTAPQFPETSLADDVARLRHVLARQTGPTIVAGHSYGGQIATALGTDAPNVVGLVYIAAFAIDLGESLGALLGSGPPTPSLAHLIVDEQGFGWAPEEDFVNHFAADLDPARARVLYAVQQGLAMNTFEDVMDVPAWRSLPSWYLVATNDQAIPPDAERIFAQRMGATTVEVPSDHLAMVSHPGETVKLIEAAADATRRPTDDSGCSGRSGDEHPAGGGNVMTAGPGQPSAPGDPAVRSRPMERTAQEVWYRAPRLTLPVSGVADGRAHRARGPPRIPHHAPLHTVIWEDHDGDAWFMVDQPSSQFASFGIPVITEVGIELDRKLAGLLEALASQSRRSSGTDRAAFGGRGFSIAPCRAAERCDGLESSARVYLRSGVVLRNDLGRAGPGYPDRTEQ